MLKNAMKTMLQSRDKVSIRYYPENICTEAKYKYYNSGLF